MSALAGQHVLLVEDEAVTGLDLTQLLESHGAEVVGPIGRVAAAVSCIESATIDCAILDVQLGTEDVSPVADLLAHADVPFIFVTAYDSQGLRARHPSHPVVGKPYRRREIVAALSAALASGAQ
jgi:DNA-binding response OmpR family regulator